MVHGGIEAVDWRPLKRWLFTTNHKDIGILYLLTSLYFFVAAGLFALTFRVQLAVPDNTFLQPDQYNQAVTTHGLLMLLWVITPLGAAFANYFVPIQIGARDMAFPRLNALSYWVYLSSGLLALSSFFAGGGTADWGWTTYAPLNTVEFSPAVGGSMMGLALMLLMASSIVSTVNFLVTIFRLRAPGMSLMRLPLFTWCWIFTSLLMLWAFPAFVSALSLLVSDRALGTVFFTSPEGGSLLWDHMFWFFGHPEVYVLLLPGFGITGDLLSTFSRRPLYAKRIIIPCLGLASILSFTVWAHHMFMTGISQSLLEAFNITTELISIPFGIIVLAYILTLRGGSIRFATPMLFAVGSLSLFIIGGVTGVFNSSIALDTAFRGTFWVVGHFHYTIVGGGLTGLFAGLYYWFPKMTGRMYSERLGRIHFVAYMVGFNLLYFPMHLLYDMPRRVYTYDVAAWGTINFWITIGGFIFGISQLIMFGNLLWSARRGPVADQDPWGGYSLEWGVPSPPPEFNFPGGVPVISASGVTYRPTAMANGGHGHAGHGEYSEEHWSRWPILVAAGAGIALWGVLMGLPALLLGTGILAVALGGWGHESLRGRHDVAEAIGERWPFERLENLSLGMWLFVFGEIAFFGALFGAYLFLRMNSSLTGFVWPAPGEVHSIYLGGFNTILLVTSGLTMVLAVTFARRGAQLGLRVCLIATFVLGALFMVNKALEWRELFQANFTFSTNVAASMYYVLTGVHGAHVIAGLTALLYLLVKAFRGGFGPGKSGSVEIFGIYWGMVDAVWVFLFPLLYLL
ncbi:MAG TPA: cbb3-type cytochrome c oxidase subunit I [Thermoplasmata archaeon]|nr:cbb3-type cytochrome c oxidase subunit I [Thermoplasmata archaeon]